MTRITELLGCKYPILQGAMAMISNPELVSAVSNSGGLGILTTSYVKDPEYIRMQIHETRKLTDKPFGINLQAKSSRNNDFIRVIADEGIKSVIVSGGSPKKIIPAIHELGAKVVVLVPTVEVALKAENAGADALIAQGIEAGGILGNKGASTMVIVPIVTDAVKIPVIAAGGIADSRGFKAAMALGAEGVQAGTRFIATRECIAHENFKNMILKSNETDTARIKLGKLKVRAMLTPFVQKIISGGSIDPIKFNDEELHKSWIEGDLSADALSAGQIIGMIDSIRSVKEVVDEMVS